MATITKTVTSYNFVSGTVNYITAGGSALNCLQTDDISYYVILPTTGGGDAFYVGYDIFNIEANSIITNVQIDVKAAAGGAQQGGFRTGIYVNNSPNYTIDGSTPTTEHRPAGSTFVNYNQTWTVNPSTGSAWTVSDINNLSRMYILSTDGSPDVYITYMTITVTYDLPTVPVITQHPTDQTATRGDLVTFTAAATSGNPMTQIWQRSINGGADWSNLTGETSTTLDFYCVYTEDGYDYRCVFTNISGDTPTNSANLTVNSVNHALAGTITSSCAANGLLAVNYMIVLNIISINGNLIGENVIDKVLIGVATDSSNILSEKLLINKIITGIVTNILEINSEIDILSKLEGSTTSSSNTNGSLLINHLISGINSIENLMIGNFIVERTLFSTIDIIGLLSAIVDMQYELKGSILGESSLSSISLYIPGTTEYLDTPKPTYNTSLRYCVSGVVDGIETVKAQTNTIYKYSLEGSISSTSSITSELASGLLSLSGNIETSTNITGEFMRFMGLVGQIENQVQIAAELIINKTLNGIVSNNSAINGVAIFDNVFIGILINNVTINAVLNIYESLIGEVSNNFNLNTEIDINRTLIGEINSYSIITGEYKQEISFEGLIEANSNIIAADLYVIDRLALVGIIPITSLASGFAQNLISLSGSCECVTSIFGEIVKVSSLTSSLDIILTIYNEILDVGKALSAILSLASSISGEIIGNYNIAGVVDSNISITGLYGILSTFEGTLITNTVLIGDLEKQYYMFGILENTISLNSIIAIERRLIGNIQGLTRFYLDLGIPPRFPTRVVLAIPINLMQVNTGIASSLIVISTIPQNTISVVTRVTIEEN